MNRVTYHSKGVSIRSLHLQQGFGKGPYNSTGVWKGSLEFTGGAPPARPSALPWAPVPASDHPSKESFNDGRIPHSHGVCVALGTGYNRVEANRRASRNGRVKLISHPKSLRYDSRLMHRCRAHPAGAHPEGREGEAAHAPWAGGRFLAARTPCRRDTCSRARAHRGRSGSYYPTIHAQLSQLRQAHIAAS